MSKHLACRALIMSPEGDSILLARRSDHDSADPGRWALFGGKVDRGETPSEAIMREVKEESGAEFVVDGHFVSHENGTWLTEFYYGRINGVLQIDPDEHSEAGFFTEPQVEALELAFDHKDIIIAYLRSAQRR